MEIESVLEKLKYELNGIEEVLDPQPTALESSTELDTPPKKLTVSQRARKNLEANKVKNKNGGDFKEKLKNFKRDF